MIKLTPVIPLTPEEAAEMWRVTEQAFTGVAHEILGRCYPKHNMRGIRGVMMSIRRTLVHIDYDLMVLEVKEVKE